MTDQEMRQQQEIERLQKKLRSLTEAYSHTAAELERLKKEEKETARRGRPGVDPGTRAKILALCQQGHSMRQIAREANVAVGTVHKIIAEASKEARIVYVYRDWGEPATIIDACSLTRRVNIVNFTNDMLSRAFGVKEKPNWEDFTDFLESRCMPRTRYGIREEMRYMGLDVYDPFQIVEKTRGRVYGDAQSLERMDADWVSRYDWIQKQVTDEAEKKQKLLELAREKEEADGSERR